MAQDHDQPNLERSVATHDAEAIEPGSTERDIGALAVVFRRFALPAGPLLDIGCGSGRHLRALAAEGHRVTGIDLDQRMLAAAEQAGVPPGCELVPADAAALDLPQRYAAALVLNRGLVCFHSHRLAWGLFTSVARHLAPGGLMVIDNCCSELWDEVAKGNYCNGLAADGEQQLFFLPGENRFVWRRGDEVDLTSWEPRPDDRIYRLWSLGEVALAAAGAGLALCCLASDSPFIVLRREEQ